MAKNELVAITGPSGVGKSTAARTINSLYPETTEVVHFDDFQKGNNDIVAELGSIENWDDPRVNDFNEAFLKLSMLSRGNPIEVRVKNEFDNPDFVGKSRFIRYPKIIQPANIVIVEGLYTIYDERVRSLFSTSIFLKGNLDTCTDRRTKGTNNEYNRKYLLPMFHQHIEPLEPFATDVLSIDGLDQKDVANAIFKILKSKFSSKIGTRKNGKK